MNINGAAMLTPVPIHRDVLEAAFVAVVRGLPSRRFLVELRDVDRIPGARAYQLGREFLARSMHGEPARSALAAIGFEIDADLTDWLDRAANSDKRHALERASVRSC